MQKPEDPERKGYTFVGWYNAGDPGDLYDFEKPVEASFTLYAVWKEEKLSPPTGDSTIIWMMIMVLSFAVCKSYISVTGKKKTGR